MTMDLNVNMPDAHHVVTIANKRGLHARASAKFVKMASGFDAKVWVSKDGSKVAGTSIMGLMLLAAAPGDQIKIEATGTQATEAISALVALVQAQFHED